MDVFPLHRTLEQELLALARGVSMECLVCGEFVQRRGQDLACAECGSVLQARPGSRTAALESGAQAG